MPKVFAICSKNDCSYSTSFDSTGLITYTITERLLLHPEDSKLNLTDSRMKEKQNKQIIPFDKEKIQSALPEDHFCEKCGSELLFYCPHCNHGLFTMAEAIHCGYCGKKIKPGKYDDIDDSAKAPY